MLEVLNSKDIHAPERPHSTHTVVINSLSAGAGCGLSWALGKAHFSKVTLLIYLHLNGTGRESYSHACPLIQWDRTSLSLFKKVYLWGEREMNHI